MQSKKKVVTKSNSATKRTPAKSTTKISATNTNKSKSIPKSTKKAVKDNVKSTSNSQKIQNTKSLPKKKTSVTPKRSDQEKKNLRPIVGGEKPRLTKEEKQQERAREMEKLQDVRVKQSEALRKTGDDRHLPERDKGEIKKYIRQVVDAKHSPAELFLIVAVVALVASLIIQQFSIVLSFYLTIIVYAYLFITIAHLIYRGQKVKKLVVEKFGDKARTERGIVMYAINRMTQPRFARLPKVGL
jgi:hypothetical protein